MRRTRRRKYTWFPILGTLDADPELSTGLLELNITTGVNPDEAGVVLTAPLIPDLTPEDVAAQQDQLVDYIGTEYYIERIVGKIHAGPVQGSSSPENVLLACGLFVARAESGGGATPIGTSTVTRNQNYGPLNPDTYQRPWMWRRTWVMSNLAAFPAAVPGPFPSTTSQGSVLDGPHVDVKSKRRVQKDERLFFAAQAVCPVNLANTGLATVGIVADFRILGRLARAKNRSAF